ncbi:transcriptional regulator, TetR family [Succinivibrio dextrinosolvens]|uniref:TetR family transcriptional regulator n=1 Tax=Succinivibrio dextrinosolvens TaxID=83771 RepID=UPI0008F31FAD|nr:TetR family transcriptional regulator [Succinivibrio dextrinosolvens]SFS74524.1 transcriptional regulator, TetR family [Succinivibrio dextrinosolvens]
MPRRTQEDSQATRRKILESAQRLFTRRGYERTSLSDIAKYAGVTRGAIYWHFENKEELLVNLMDFLDKEKFSIDLLHEAADPDEKDPLSKLKGCIKSMVDEEGNKFISSSLMSMIISIMAGSTGNEEVRTRVFDFIKSRHDLMNKIFRNCISKGQLPSNLAIEAAQEHLAVFCVGFFHQSRLGYTENFKKNFEFFVDREFEELKTFTTDKIR